MKKGKKKCDEKSLQQQYTHLVQRVEFGEIFYQSTNSSQCHYFVIVLFNFQDNAIWKRRIPWKIDGVLWRCLSFSVFWVIREDSLVVVFSIFLTKWWWCWFWCRFLASCFVCPLSFCLPEFTYCLIYLLYVLSNFSSPIEQHHKQRDERKYLEERKFIQLVWVKEVSKQGFNYITVSIHAFTQYTTLPAHQNTFLSRGNQKQKSNNCRAEIIYCFIRSSTSSEIVHLCIPHFLPSHLICFIIYISVHLYECVSTMCVCICVSVSVYA